MMRLGKEKSQLNIVNGEKLVLSEKKAIEIVVEDKQGGSNFKLNGAVCNLKQQKDGLSFGVMFDVQSNEQVSQLLLSIVTSQD